MHHALTHAADALMHHLMNMCYKIICLFSKFHFGVVSCTVNINNMPKEHLCEICRKGFSRAYDVKRHMRKIHVDRPVKVPTMFHFEVGEKLPPSSNALQHPFTCMVSGPTGTGKTMWVERLLLNAMKTIFPPPARVVWCYTQWQPIYDRLLLNVSGIEFHQGIPSQIDRSSFFDVHIPNLVVLDDLMVESSGDKTISNLFTRGSHHMNLSVIYIVQNLFSQGKMSRNISLNSQYLVLFKSPRDKQQIRVLARQLYPQNTNTFLNTYEEAIKKPHGYLFVDLKPSTPDDQRLKFNILPGEESDKETMASSGSIQKLADSVQTFIQGQRYMQPPQLAEVQKLNKQMINLLQNQGVPDDVKAKMYGQLFQRQQNFSNALTNQTSLSNSYGVPSSSNTSRPSTQSPIMEAKGERKLESPAESSNLFRSAESGIGSMNTRPSDMFQKIKNNIEERRKRLTASQGTPSRFLTNSYLSSMDSEQMKQQKLQQANVTDGQQFKRRIFEQPERPTGPLAQAWISMTDDQNIKESKIHEAEKRRRKPKHPYSPSDF